MISKQEELLMKEATDEVLKEQPIAEKGKQQEVVQKSPKNNYQVDVREVRTNYFDPIVWQQMKGMAEVFKASGALGKDENASTLVMKIQAGYEMGMKPIESIKSFYFVNGLLSIFGAATVRRLREHGWNIQYKEEKNKCTAIIRKGEESFTDTLTFEEAQQSNWTSVYGKLKPGWYEGANRKMKLRYGVTSMLIKTYVPEVLGSAVDITEVAIDTVPIISGENTKLEIAGENEPVNEDQIETLKSLGVPLTEIQKMTKQDAINMFKELIRKR
jgi:hypothetical protein